MKAESKTLVIHDLNGNTRTEVIMVNPEFPTYAIEMRGIAIGHEFHNGPVGATVLDNGIIEIHEYKVFSEDMNGTKGRKLAEIEVL